MVGYTRADLEKRFPDLDRFPGRYLVAVRYRDGEEESVAGGFAEAIEPDGFVVTMHPNGSSWPERDGNVRKARILISGIQQIRSEDLYTI